MKRIVVFIVTLAILTGILSGCMGIRKPSDNSHEKLSSLNKGSVIYHSEENEVSGLSVLTWSKIDKRIGKHVETTGTKIQDALRAENDPAQLDIPELFTNQQGKITVLVPVNGQVTHVYLLDMTDRNYPMTETTWDEIEALTPGRYYIVTQVLLSGNCDPDALQHSFLYEELFCLVVQ